MKRLIVNADDFGASRGINRGILESARRGIVTSTSLLVNAARSEEAVQASRMIPELSIGLHVDLDAALRQGVADDPGRLRDELQRQFATFVNLMGREPSHIDAHHDVHRDPRVLPAFLELARGAGLPLRGHGAIRYVSRFHGRWNGESHPEQVGPEELQRILEADVLEGTTELGCHPGYVDAEFQTSYTIEREVERRTLCDPSIPSALRRYGIALVSFRDVGRPASLSAG